MRIAHFVQRYPPALGGSEAFFARLGRHLARAGDRVTVYTTTALDLSAFWSLKGKCLPSGVSQEDGVEVRRYSLWRWPGRRYLLKPLSLIPVRPWQCLTMPCNPLAMAMMAAAKGGGSDVDVVHATAFPYAWPLVCARILARRKGVPLVLTPFIHTGDPADPRDPTRRAYTTPALLSLLRSADKVFVQTAGERALLETLGLPADQLVDLGMGVDHSECTGGNRDRVRQVWGATGDEVVIGHLANNSREKGTIDLARAANLVWRRGHRFRLVLAGPAMPNFGYFWKDFHPAGPVLRMGILSEEEKRDFYAGIDVFALPSRSDSFGLVLLEAWANRVPNVAYRAGGVADVIRHRQDGLLTPCGDIQELAAALESMINQPTQRIIMGENGYERALRDFQWSDKLRQVRDVYQQLKKRAADGTRIKHG